MVDIGSIQKDMCELLVHIGVFNKKIPDSVEKILPNNFKVEITEDYMVKSVKFDANSYINELSEYSEIIGDKFNKDEYVKSEEFTKIRVVKAFLEDDVIQAEVIKNINKTHSVKNVDFFSDYNNVVNEDKLLKFVNEMMETEEQRQANIKEIIADEYVTDPALLNRLLFVAKNVFFGSKDAYTAEEFGIMRSFSNMFIFNLSNKKETVVSRSVTGTVNIMNESSIFDIIYKSETLREFYTSEYSSPAYTLESVNKYTIASIKKCRELLEKEGMLVLRYFCGLNDIGYNEILKKYQVKAKKGTMTKADKYAMQKEIDIYLQHTGLGKMKSEMLIPATEAQEPYKSKVLDLIDERTKAFEKKTLTTKEKDYRSITEGFDIDKVYTDVELAEMAKAQSEREKKAKEIKIVEQPKITTLTAAAIPSSEIVKPKPVEVVIANDKYSDF